jgi:hypothetical protein
MWISIATGSTWLGSNNVLSPTFFFVVILVLAMLVTAIVGRAKTSPLRSIIAFFPAALALLDRAEGAGWSFLTFRTTRVHGTLSGIIYGLDQAMISIVCASFGLLFAMESLRGPERWQRIFGVVFGVHAVAVLVYMPASTHGWL